MARPGFVLADGDLESVSDRESVSVMNVLNDFDHNDKSSAVAEMGDRGHTATIDMT